uniref:Peroxisomal membrane protein MPV17 n=1 Tax=Leersia perrieri TaxID=77586 RepID=A0A0D9XB20_9ORYZ
MSEVVAMAGQAYMRQLQAHPLRTKAITSGVLAGCSDAIAQKISGVTKLQRRRLLLIMVKSKLKKDYASVQLTAWKFWPIVSWINYEYMPLQLRVLFHSLVASCWAVFLNLKAARSIATSKKE